MSALDDPFGEIGGRWPGLVEELFGEEEAGPPPPTEEKEELVGEEETGPPQPTEEEEGSDLPDSEHGSADEKGYCADSENEADEVPKQEPARPEEKPAEPEEAQEPRPEDQCPDGCLPTLPATAQRTNVHYVHYRTHGPDDRQPESFTQKELWEHLEDCYRKAYPVPGAKTGSIVAYGMVAKERHKDSPIEANRSEHNHAPVATTQRHYWSKVVKESRKAGVHLHAVEHEAYGVMYKYLKNPTRKKPLHELDPSPYLSPDHPKGDALKELLERAAVSAAGNLRRKPQPAAGQEEEERQPKEGRKRQTLFALGFSWAVDHNLLGKVGAKQMQADAVSEFEEGRPRLLEFVQKHRGGLEDQLDYIWELKAASAAVERMKESRVDVLLRAATATDAGCKNTYHPAPCGRVYEEILRAQKVDSVAFRHALFCALDLGRRVGDLRMKGNAVMLVGGKDTGKSTITDPMFVLYKVFPTPPASSNCPLMKCRGHEVFLWQDFRYAPGKPGSAEDRGLRLDEGSLNRLLEGYATLVQMPKNEGADFVFHEDTPFIATGPFQLTAYTPDGEVDEYETEQMTTRFTYFFFRNSILKANQHKGFGPCAKCWAKWLLHGEIVYRREHGRHPKSTTDVVEKAKAALFPKGEEDLGAYEQQIAPKAPKRPAAGPPATPPRLKGSSTGAAAAEISGGTSTGAAGAPTTGGRFEELRKLVSWREAGLLSKEEFDAAKQEFFAGKD